MDLIQSDNNLSNNRVWEQVLSDIKTQVSPGVYKTWFSSTTLSQITTHENSAEVEVVCPNNFCRQQLSSRYQSLILGMLEEHLGLETTVKFSVSTTQNPKVQQQVDFEPQTTTPKTPIVAPLNSSHIFETFVVGKSNNLAFAAAQAVVASPGSLYNPLFIWGGVGVGKTHLMQAIGNAISQNNPDSKTIYTTCERFTNEFIDSLRSKQNRQFRDRYRRADLLLIDDIQFLAGKESTQEEFFHTFNELYQSGRQIVLTSDRHPSEIGKIEDRLVSRFLGGLTVDVGQPDYEMRVAIIENKRSKLGIEISPEVVEYLAQNVTNNIRELEGALTQIVSMSKLLGQSPSLESARQFLGKREAESHKIVSPKEILIQTARFYNLKPSDLIGPKRDRGLVRPRQITMYLVRQYLRTPLVNVGQLLGGRDHTTIMHGVKTIEAEMKRSIEVAKEVEEIKSSIFN